MGIFNRNRNTLPPLDQSPRKQSKPITKETKRRAVYTALLSVGFVFTYFLLQAISDKIYQRTNSLFLMYTTVGVYAVGLAVLLLAYIIYNRAFTMRNVTPEMLSDDLTYEQKLEMIESAKARMQKSKWMLMLIIPLIVTFIFDACYQFIWIGMLEKYFV